MSTTKHFVSNTKQSSDQGPTEEIRILFVGIGLLTILLLVALVAFGGGPGLVVPFLCSVITLVWAIWVTVWICKIKNLQTEAVRVQTETVRVQTETIKVLEQILEETKAHRPRWLNP